MTNPVEGHMYDKAIVMYGREIDELNTWLYSKRKIVVMYFFEVAVTRSTDVIAKVVASVIAITDTGQDETSSVVMDIMVASEIGAMDNNSCLYFARGLFDESLQWDAVDWNALIIGYL